jgi:hypothetical protein
MLSSMNTFWSTVLSKVKSARTNVFLPAFSSFLSDWTFYRILSMSCVIMYYPGLMAISYRLYLSMSEMYMILILAYYALSSENSIGKLSTVNGS